VLTLLLRSGVDIVEVKRLENLGENIRPGFLSRVFTSLELEENQDNNQFLAGRFAAKEAVAKALGCGIGPISWQDVEITRGLQGEPQLHLYGEAQRMADALGLVNWSISISHSDAYAVAVVVALGEVA
jgi:holo-[acyl-carrier protein] synthase